MDKDLERRFLETLSKALVSLPFDVKVLLEAVSDQELEHSVREIAAATVIHVIAPKEGNVEAPVRHAEDVLLLRLALAKIAAEGGEGAQAFRDRFAENYGRLYEEMALFGEVFGGDVMTDGWSIPNAPVMVTGTFGY